MQITITLPHGVEQFKGELLGRASSHQEHHNHTTDYIQPGTDARGRKLSCKACRWQEVDIYEDYGTDGFVVYTNGRSIIPGEHDYVNLHRTDTAMGVRELLTVRKPEGKFMPAPARMALAAAAELDEDLREVYDTLPAGL